MSAGAAWERVGQIYEEWQRIVEFAADADDTLLSRDVQKTSQFLRRALRRTGQLARDERAVRGLGDPAVTSKSDGRS